MTATPSSDTAPAEVATGALDAYATEYEQALNQGLRFSGDDSRYFAEGRLHALAVRLHELDEQPRIALDFGCGTGRTAALLKEFLGVEHAIGVDVSPHAVASAQHSYGRVDVEFALRAHRPVCEEVDLAYCNGVVHHIPASERDEAIGYVHAALRPGGLFALCENNPWNPGTRLVMRSIPFDRGVVPLRPAEARRLLRAGSFEVLRTDFLFVFPHGLRLLHRSEPLLQRVPLGAQYMVLARKPTRRRRRPR